MNSTVTFENLPALILTLQNEIEELKTIILNQSSNEHNDDLPINIQDVSALTGLKVNTLYGYCQRREIPYQKKGNRLYFFKSEIIEWLKADRKHTVTEMLQKIN
ncbi:hypothetical protein AAU57_08710 [Nonlabens sp. YIK11]|uniref:helix-turn-helix domain-containing protein n=1 Tax=Nonlabens sp. YIK11 TaxID=1453349 RepID=UPI0006DC428C|nr:helix-turn-helix domain-containing protein [Nonlabens sp. YIK11]KQC33384.1 hypothetical protein AAU57_08710 [Nonlabens sp. YIK11]